MTKLTLKKALESNELDKFIKQNQDRIGCQKSFNSILESAINKSKLTHQTCSEDSSEN